MALNLRPQLRAVSRFPLVEYRLLKVVQRPFPSLSPAVDERVKGIETTDAQWDQVQDVNLRGTFFGCREAGKRMAAAGRGVIVNITSVSAYRGRASVGHYAAAKHGVAGLTKSLAVELGARGVRVVAVSPCMTETPGLDEQRRVSQSGGAKSDSFQDMEARIRSSIPLRRFGHPDDVARAVLFCASDLAGFVTASTVFADGGVSAI
jgi:NAD(P)-dependent dehydrogenase (short-subunit alcohol dehydrogenase family)